MESSASGVEVEAVEEDSDDGVLVGSEGSDQVGLDGEAVLA